MKSPLVYTCQVLLLLFFSSSLNFIHAQTRSLTYKLDIKREKSTYLVNMYPLANGDNLVSSYDIGDTITTKLRFVRIKPDGKIVWSKTYTEPNYYQYYVVAAATNDNGFIAAARLDSGTKYSLGTVLFKCDSSGDIEWKQKLITADHSATAPGPIIQTKDEGYYFVNYSYGVAQLEKLDKNGYVVWSKAFNPSYSDYGYNLDKLAEAADGGALLTVYNISCEYYCIAYSLYKFQKNGNPASVIDFDPSFYFGTTAYYLSEDSAGVIRMIAGGDILSLYNYLGAKYSYVIIQPDAINAKAFIINHDLLSLQHFFKTNKIAMLNNKIYTTGRESPYFNFSKDWSLSVASDKYNAKGIHYVQIERYDSLGRICPNYKIPFVDTTILQKGAGIYRSVFSVINMPAVLVTNSNLSSTPLQNYDSILCIGEVSTISTTNNNIAAKALPKIPRFSIFPNPAKDYINLELSNDKSSSAQIQIISIDGKIIKAFTSYFAIGTIIKTYDISYLPKGVYLLKVTTQATQQTIKFIKE